MNFKKLNLSKQRISDAVGDLIAELVSLLAEEYQAWYNYRLIQPYLQGLERSSVSDKFVELAKDELDDHANKLLNRLAELNYGPVLLTPLSWHEYSTINDNCDSTIVIDQLYFNRDLEIKAIEHYNKVIQVALYYSDFVTSDLLKSILADEENHLNILNDFINDFNTVNNA